MWWTGQKRARQASEIAFHSGQLAERHRIARELHDTLLQGLQGLSLQLDLLAENLPGAHPEKLRATSLRLNAERVLQESRQWVTQIRSPAATADDLFVMLIATARELSGWSRQEVRICTTGHYRALATATVVDIHLVCREALINVMKHAQADVAEVTLHYATQWLDVRISSSGPFTPSRLQRRHGADSGWGMQGMAERAAHIGGEMQVACVPQGGMTVTLRIPGSMAYAGPLTAIGASAANARATPSP